MANESTTEAFRVNLPQDLVAEAGRQARQKPDTLRVEGWRTSWLTRVSEFLVGKE